MLKDSSESNLTVPSSASVSEKGGRWIAPFSLLSIATIFFVAQLIGGLLLYFYSLSLGWDAKQFNHWIDNSVVAQFVYLLISESLVMLGVYGCLKFLRWNWRTIGLIKPKLIHIIVGAVSAVPYYVLFITIVAILSHLIPSLNVDQKQEIGFNNVVGQAEIILTFISLVVLPPIVEEIAMRGYLYTGLKKWLPKIVAGLIVSVAFGAAHLVEGGTSGPLWIGAIDTAILSIVLVGLREATGNLWAGITLHAVKNGVAFLALYIFHVV